MSATQTREPSAEPQAQPNDAGRWLVTTLIVLAKTFLTRAAAAGFSEARQKSECPRCGWRG